MSKTIVFKAQKGVQEAFLTCPVKDILYGGAKGGGKSYGIIGHFLSKSVLVHRRFQKNSIFTGILIRRSYPELEHIISQAKKILKGVASFNETKKVFTFPQGEPYGGAILRFRFLEKDSDADNYQGQEFQWIGIEEAGNFSDPSPINIMRSCLRSGDGVPCYFVMTANPGGVGHNWLKREYVDPAPPNTPFAKKVSNEKDSNTVQRVYIPAKITDNKILMDNDPSYIDRIKLACEGKQWLLDAWLNGNWEVLAGGMFDDVWKKECHIIEPFPIPVNWKIYRAYDWGSSKPFSIGWWALTDGTVHKDSLGKEVSYPRDTLIRIDEWYGSTGKPDEGLKLLERDIAKEVKQREINRGWPISGGVADLNIFNRINGMCLADEHKKYGIFWTKADKRAGSRVVGWQDIRARFSAGTKYPYEHPALFVFDHCREFVRTVPSAPRDTKNQDDILSSHEDHILDEMRYIVSFVKNRIGTAPLYGL